MEKLKGLFWRVEAQIMQSPQVRRAVLSLAVLLLALIAPTSSLAADCQIPTWDEATKTATQRIRSGDSTSRIEPEFDADGFIACGAKFPDARTVSIVSEKTLDIQFGVQNIQHLVGDPSSEIDLHVSFVSEARAMDTWISVSRWKKQASIPLNAALTADGIDLDSDGDGDIFFDFSRGGRLILGPPTGTSSVRLDGSILRTKFEAISVTPLRGAHPGRRLYVNNPHGSAGVGGGPGNDTITVVGKTGGAQGYNGNDTIDARGVTNGGTFLGGSGNDRLLLGPGDDSINERNKSDGNDYYDTGAGNDYVYSAGGTDTIHTGAGNDRIVTIANTGKTMNVIAGAGNDRHDIFAPSRPGRTTTTLGAGNDHAQVWGKVTGNWRAARINCGTGRDTYQGWGMPPILTSCERTIQ